MTARGVKNYFILGTIIVILLTNSSLAVAQSQNGYHPQGLFNLQFVLSITWNANDTYPPIHPGELRKINLTITYTVTRGVLGRMLLQLLRGRPFPIQLSIENKSEWCTPEISSENLTGIIIPDEIGIVVSILSIRLNEDAPGNYTLGFVKIHGTIEDKKGPLNLLTLIHGYEQDFTITFIPGP
jgi:hypothetical protein